MASLGSTNKRKRTVLRDESIINQTKVSLTMVKHLFSKESNNNIVFSPLSLQVVLSIIAAGSEGPTREQLLDCLRSKSTDHLNSFVSQLVSIILSDAAPSGGPRLSVANGVWVEQSLSLQPSFKKIVSTDYNATLSSVDFQNKADEVTNDVNLWAKNETNGVIEQILPKGSVNNLTRLIFANALYFKGVWDQKFDVLKTKDYDFYILNGSSVKVPFMTSKEDQFISTFNDFKVLRLRYKQGEDNRQFSMYFFLPDAKNGLLALTENLAFESEFLEHRCPRKKVIVGDFRIPRFKVSFGFETSNMLKELGVVLPFSRGGLTKMVESENLCISSVFQKSFIEVNEKGTEAAAVSAIGMKGTCARYTSPPIPIDFVADHPFLFLIREDLSGTVLFVGQVLNPLVM